MVDYSLWGEIENGNKPPVTTIVKGVKTIIASATAEEKAQKRLELKARITLLMGIPNEHQLKFNSTKDAKSLLHAVEKRFGENAATKKTKGNLLKWQYENFTTSSLEVLDQNFDRLQNLISQLEIHGESISQEDVNQKFLRSLSPEWNTHTIVWRNKPDINTLSLDDLYNNLNIYEPEMDLRWQMAMVTMRARRFLKNTRRKFSMNGNETIGFDKYKVDCYNCHKRGYFARDCKALRNQENKNIESTRRIVPIEAPASLALVSCDELGDSEDEAESKPKIEKKTVKPSFAKIESVKSKEQVKSPRKTTVKKGNPQQDLQEKGVIDSRFSRHMIGNMSYLTNFEEIDKGYVAFGGNPKGGKITGKYTIRTGVSGSNKKPNWNVGSVAKLVILKGNDVMETRRITQVLVVQKRGLRTNPKTKTYELVEDVFVLYMGDDHFTPVQEKGSVVLEFSSGKSITLFNVLYVPKLRIIPETTAPYTPQQNGMVERKSKDLKDMVNSMLSYSSWSDGFWGEAMLPDRKRKTLGKKGIDYIFVGYAGHFKACRFYIIEPNDNVSINTIIDSRDAIFDENHFPSIPRSKDIIPNLDGSQRDDHSNDVPSETLEPCKGKRVRKAKLHSFDFQLYFDEGLRDQIGSQYSYCYSIEEDPRTYNEARQSRDVTF
nr:hypothetical protein [Tanacetum cinerariifolium]